MANTLRDWFDRSREHKYAKKITNSDEAWKLWNDERLRAQTDLFWLSKYVLGYDLVDNFYCVNHPLTMSDGEGYCSECFEPFQPYPGGIPDESGFICSPHRLMCNFFVKKDPKKSIAAQDTEKNRLMMMPRGSFKSSVDEADVVQWIIGFPNVRIILLTAADDLATDFVSHVKKFFTVTQEDLETNNLTQFQLLFPEHCVLDKDKGAADRFITPARTNDKLKDPTLRALSLVGETSGKHADVGKYDDCVSNRNSGPGATAEQRETVRKNIQLARSLVEPYGYHDNIGTPYDEADAYAYQLAHSTIGIDLKYLRRPAWQVKDEAGKKKSEELNQFDYHILFPVYWRKKGEDGKIVAEETPCLTYGFLRKSQHDDPANFACQYLCLPSAARTVKITEQMINSHTVASSSLPQDYECYSAWDLAWSTERGRDYSVGSVGWFSKAEGRGYVVDIRRGRFSKSELPYQIASQAAKWRVKRIRIEKSPGAEFIENDINRELIKLGYECPIDFIPIDTDKGAKEARVEYLENLLVSDRMFFSAEIDIMKEVTKELVKFKPSSKRKDDIPDSLAHLMALVPEKVELPALQEEQQRALRDILIQKQLYERIYPDAPPPAPELPPQAPKNYEGMPVYKNWDEYYGYGS